MAQIHPGLNLAQEFGTSPLAFRILGILLLFTISNAQTILPSETVLPAARVGIPYIQTFSFDRPTLVGANATISNLSTLPPGLMLNGNQLLGIPFRSGNQTITLRIITNNTPANNTQRAYNLIINGIATSSVLPKTFVNVPFSFNVSYVGGIPPFSWASSGLPQWLRLNNSLMFGTPERVGNTTFSILLTDLYSNSLNRTWTLSTEQNALILVPVMIRAQTNVPVRANFTASNGVPPYTFEYVNIPADASAASNRLNFTVDSPGQHLMGVFVTDSKGMRNYFSVRIVTENSSQSMARYITNITNASYTDDRTGRKVIIYNVPPIDLSPGFAIQNSNNAPNFSYDSVRARPAPTPPPQKNSIRTATTIDNTNPCYKPTTTIEGSGTVTDVNLSESTIQLNTRVVLTFQECTMQAFRGRSQSFEEGNFVTYEGIPRGSGILLVSITNTT